MSLPSGYSTDQSAKRPRLGPYQLSDVVPTETVKHPLKIMVWVMMGYRELSEPHFVPSSQNVTTEYYVEEVSRRW